MISALFFICDGEVNTEMICSAVWSSWLLCYSRAPPDSRFLRIPCYSHLGQLLKRLQNLPLLVVYRGKTNVCRCCCGRLTPRPGEDPPWASHCSAGPLSALAAGSAQLVLDRKKTKKNQKKSSLNGPCLCCQPRGVLPQSPRPGPLRSSPRCPGRAAGTTFPSAPRGAQARCAGG